MPKHPGLNTRTSRAKPGESCTGASCRQKHRHINTDSKIEPGIPRKTAKNQENTQKLRDPAPTYEVSVSKPSPGPWGRPGGTKLGQKP